MMRATELAHHGNPTIETPTISHLAWEEPNSLNFTRLRRHVRLVTLF